MARVRLYRRIWPFGPAKARAIRSLPAESEDPVFKARRYDLEQNALDVRFTSDADPVTTAIKGSFVQIAAHHAREREVKEKFYVKKYESNREENSILAQRLMKSYLSMHDYEMQKLSAEARPNSGLWEMAKHEFQGPFFELMAQKDIEGLAIFLDNAMRERITFGLGPSKIVFDAVNVIESARNGFIQLTIDRLLSVAEAMGAVRCENPEQGGYGVSSAMSATELVNLIEDVVKAPICRSPEMGNYGVVVNGGIVDVRVPDDAYTAWRASGLMKDHRLTDVCEIGGGLGGTALQCHRMGCSRYTIADIPVISTIQGWFIAKQIGIDKVCFGNEDYNGQPVQLIPWWQFFDRSRRFDFVINRDSLPEIPEDHAARYIDEIAARGAYLLSINQESCAGACQGDLKQLWVRALVERHGGFRCLSRHRAWTRVGYVEEVFRPMNGRTIS